MSARALIRESDLRRWARISREEGVAIKGRVDANGLTMSITPVSNPAERESDDLDRRLDEFGSS